MWENIKRGAMLGIGFELGRFIWRWVTRLIVFAAIGGLLHAAGRGQQIMKQATEKAKMQQIGKPKLASKEGAFK